MARGRPNHASSPTRVRSTKRTALALDLRAQGYTWAEVAQRAGYKTLQAAHMAVKNALEHTLQEPAEHLRNIELQRLEKLQTVWFPKALDGDKDAATVVLKTAERRAKLLGLDAPTQIQAVPPGVTREEAEAMLLQRLERLPKGDA